MPKLKNSVVSSQSFPVESPYFFAGPLPFPLFQGFFHFWFFWWGPFGPPFPFFGLRSGWRVGSRAFSAWSTSLATGVGDVPFVLGALLRDEPGESVSISSLGFHSVKKTVVENMDRYKQSLIDFTIAGHHRANCSSQLKSGEFPEGLKCKLTPLIFKMSEATQHKWKDALKELSFTLVKISQDHYVQLIQHERENQQFYMNEIEHAISRLNLSREDIAFLERLWQELTKSAKDAAKVEYDKRLSIRENRANRKRPSIQSEQEDEQLPRTPLPDSPQRAGGTNMENLTEKAVEKAIAKRLEKISSRNPTPNQSPRNGGYNKGRGRGNNQKSYRGNYKGRGQGRGRGKGNHGHRD